ncbi:MAG: isochorismate synthase [Porphyromonadaceae bacterium]|nr:isochorismate synthase [Porphyromonadaceae bacterium]
MAISNNIVDWDELSQALEQRKALGLPWVLYHEPDSPSIGLLLFTSDSLSLATDWQSLPRGEGFLIAPFTIGPDSPIVFLNLESRAKHLSYLLPQEVISCDSPIDRQVNREPSDSYRRDFDNFTLALSEGTFDKLVLARSYDYELSVPLSILQTFLRASNCYPSAYTYSLYTPQTGHWLGSTPELLCSVSGERFSTMALAGTQPAPNDGQAPRWSEQHLREQGCVTDYIVQALRELKLEPHLSHTYEVQAGALVHLRTDIAASLDGKVSTPQLLEALHPTPAVCGLPKDESLRFIVQHEQTERGYYAGCLGHIGSNGGESRIYVNLRCMQLLSPNIVRLYAGGGLLLGARLEDEWLETERKMQTMRNLLIL